RFPSRRSSRPERPASGPPPTVEKTFFSSYSLLLFDLIFQGKCPDNGLMGAGSHAISAANALSVIGGTKHIHIHLAYPAACAAGGALVRIHRQPVDRDPVAQAVKDTQGAQPFTERTVEEHRQHYN